MKTITFDKKNLKTIEGALWMVSPGYNKDDPWGARYQPNKKFAILLKKLPEYQNIVEHLDIQMFTLELNEVEYKIILDALYCVDQGTRKFPNAVRLYFSDERRVDAQKLFEKISEILVNSDQKRFRFI